MRCKVQDCDKPVEMVADKLAESVSYRKPCHIVLYPSMEALHGRCYYHQRKHEASIIMAQNLRRREEKAKEQRELVRRLFKLSIGGSTI